MYVFVVIVLMVWKMGISVVRVGGRIRLGQLLGFVRVLMMGKIVIIVER